MFLWSRKNLKTDEVEVSKVQGALRPIQLFEYIFPEMSPIIKDGKIIGESENLKEVLAMLNLQDAFPLRPEVNNYAWIMRKMMRAKKIPNDIIESIKGKPRDVLTERFVVKDNIGMAVYPLGIKHDQMQDFHFNTGESYRQEGL